MSCLKATKWKEMKKLHILCQIQVLQQWQEVEADHLIT